MKSSKSIKSIFGTVITAVIIIAMVALNIALSDYTMTSNQLKTLNILVIICAASALFCFTVGEATSNFSQMDKLWSLLPIAYLWITAIRGSMSARLVVYASIVTVWGIRLTVNFARKGAYKLKFWDGVEDYRWSIVHGNPIFKHRIAWSLFDLFFISVYQNALVLAICLPSVVIMESTEPFGAWDAIAAVLALLFLILETVSDEYQWKYHQTKKELLAKSNAQLPELPKPYDLGFNTLGPWARMRHPNYLGEQGIWLSLYIFTIGAGVTNYIVFNWSLTGPLALVLLFMGSSSLSESISSGKYPHYKDYVNTVFKYVLLRRYK